MASILFMEGWLGIIDSIVLLSAPIGMYVVTKISGFGIVGFAFI
jgi:hypothetical protein